MDLPFSFSSSFLLLCIIINIQDYICNIYTKEKKKQEKQLWPSRKVSTGQYNVVIDVQKQGVTELTNISQCKTNCSDV